MRGVARDAFQTTSPLWVPAFGDLCVIPLAGQVTCWDPQPLGSRLRGNDDYAKVSLRGNDGRAMVSPEEKGFCGWCDDEGGGSGVESGKLGLILDTLESVGEG